MHEGAWQLKDRHRNRLCGCCWAKLAKTTGDPRIVDGVRICLDCRSKKVDPVTGPAAIASVTEAVARPARAALPPTPVFTAAVPQEWQAYLWCILDGKKVHGLFEWSTHMLAAIKAGGLVRWQEMRTGFFQHDACGREQLPDSTTKILASLFTSGEIIGRRLLHDLGVDASDYVCRDMEILAMLPLHSKPQCIHFDLTERHEAQQCYVVVVYLTEGGTISTAFTQRHPDELAACWTENNAMPPYSTLQLITRKHFGTRPVDFADASVFRADVCHFGERNPDDKTRYVAFFSFQPRTLSLTCATQRYPWGVRS